MGMDTWEDVADRSLNPELILTKGRELDALVSSKVMGLTSGCQTVPWSLVPRYSTNIQDAWQVVEHLRRQGWLVVVKEMPDGFPFLGPDDMDPQPRVFRRACCSLQWISTKGVENTRRSIHLHPIGLGDTVPEAICRAALDAVALLERWEDG